jgi:hypothetical protein
MVMAVLLYVMGVQVAQAVAVAVYIQPRLLLPAVLVQQVKDLLVELLVAVLTQQAVAVAVAVLLVLVAMPVV